MTLDNYAAMGRRGPEGVDGVGGETKWVSQPTTEPHTHSHSLLSCLCKILMALFRPIFIISSAASSTPSIGN